MSTPVTIADLKAQAKALRAVLTERGISKAHTACLEEVARQRGFKDFRAAKAALGNAPLVPPSSTEPFPEQYASWLKDQNWVAVNDPYRKLSLEGQINWRIGDIYYPVIEDLAAGFQSTVTLHHVKFGDMDTDDPVRIPFAMFYEGFRKHQGTFDVESLINMFSDGQYRLLHALQQQGTMTWEEIEQFDYGSRDGCAETLFWQGLIKRDDLPGAPPPLAIPHDAAAFELGYRGDEVLEECLITGRIKPEGAIGAAFAPDNEDFYRNRMIRADQHWGFAGA